MNIVTFSATSEQIIYAQKLVLHSLENHSVADVWAKSEKTYQHR